MGKMGRVVDDSHVQISVVPCEVVKVDGDQFVFAASVFSVAVSVRECGRGATHYGRTPFSFFFLVQIPEPKIGPQNCHLGTPTFGALVA